MHVTGHKRLRCCTAVTPDLKALSIIELKKFGCHTVSTFVIVSYKTNYHFGV